MMLNKRIAWVDVFKGLTILLVVIGHTNSPITVYIYLFHVPAFFFISGFTTTFDKESIKAFALKRIRSLMIPFFSINIIFFVLNVILTGTKLSKFLTDPLHIQVLLNSISNLFLHGAGPVFGGATWFLLVLFEASILVKILFTFCKKFFRRIPVKEIEVWSLFAVSILLLLWGYYLYSIKSYSNYALDLCLNAQFYIVLGLLFRRFSLFEKFNKIIFIMAAVFAMYYFSKIHWAPMNWPTRDFSTNPLNNILSSLAGIYLTYVLSNLILGAKIIKDAFIYLGMRTLSVLGFHFLGMKVSYFIFYYLRILPHDQLKQFIPPVANNYWPMLTLSCILFSLGVERIINRNRFAALMVLGKKLEEGPGHLNEIAMKLPYFQEFIRIVKIPFRAFHKLNDQEKSFESANLYSRPVRSDSRYKETLIVVALSGLIIVLLNMPAFNGFFMSEDFNWRSLYLAANGNLFKAMFTPITGIFFRPASILWVIGTQLVLPWDPFVHHIRNFLFTLINLFLLYRIMLRVSASCIARLIGIAFFTVSMVHLTTIGLINALEIIVTLLHFLLTLLFLIRYFQGQKNRDYFLSLIFFTFGVFSRDYSVVFIFVIGVLFCYFAYGNYTVRKSWREAFFKFLPFILVACGYLLIRFTILGLPKAGGSAPYAINFSIVKTLKDALIYAGAFLNLSISPTYADSIGRGDFSTLITGNKICHRIYEILFLFLGSVLFIITVLKGIRYKKWCLFSLVWALIIIAPTVLISRPFIYYIYEGVAAVAILLSMCLDYKAPGRESLLGFWVFTLLVIGINGYAHNQNVDSYAWRWVANIVSNVNQQIFIPNRGLSIRSLTIVTSNIEQAQFMQYVIDPTPFLNEPMIKALMTAGQKIDFRIIKSQDYKLTDRMSQENSDLVYLLKASDYSFIRILPVRKDACLSFENNSFPLKTVWILNTKTSYKLNDEYFFDSDGKRPVRVSVEAEGMADNHFGGIELPLPKNGQFTIDLWVDRPKDLKAIYVYEMDDEGHAFYSWINDNPGDTLVANFKYELIFRIGSDDINGFKWTPQKKGHLPKVLHIFLNVKDHKKVNYYLDQLCVLSTAP